MYFSQKTILGLFDSSQKYFTIPVYQRAYSWDKDQWSVFLADIREQIKGNNNYFYGNLLLETIKKDIHYEIIDGQQRLTTLTIFMRAIINLLSSRKKKGEKIKIDLRSKERIYLKNSGTIKVRPVEYDQACFDTLIIDNKDKFETFSPSQDRIKNAKDFFLKELGKENTLDLIKILSKIESTELTCIELEGKKDAALMFELQNNRGKDLTNMEKLKSYLMYQMYVYSKKEETESNIEFISNIFKSIYLLINDLQELNEDSVLIYHCNAYVNGYYYRGIADIKEAFKGSKEKVDWIKQFVSELHTSFSNIKKIEGSKDVFFRGLREMGMPAFVYPFFIKGYKYFGNDKSKLSKLFHVLEIVVFRYQLSNSRADIISRLNEILNRFNGNLFLLKNHFKEKLNLQAYYGGGAEYWGEKRILEKLNGDMSDNNVINYLLWRYEDSIQGKGYAIGNGAITSEQIEHISPQTPTDDEPIATGYEIGEDGKYNDGFIDEYLNCLGNLMLISGSHNSSIGNKPFAAKLKSYKANPLLKQQAEIVSFIDLDNPKWHRDEIEKRHEKILNFCLEKWSFDSVDTSMDEIPE